MSTKLNIISKLFYLITNPTKFWSWIFYIPLLISEVMQGTALMYIRLKWDSSLFILQNGQLDSVCKTTLSVLKKTGKFCNKFIFNLSNKYQVLVKWRMKWQLILVDPVYTISMLPGYLGLSRTKFKQVIKIERTLLDIMT